MTLFTGTATDHQDLFNELKAAACGYGTISNQSTGSNVGDGTLTGVEGRASAVTEVITLTAVAGGLSFGVVGSVSGSMGTAFVDHSYDDGKVAFELNSGGITFDEGDDFSFNVTQGEAAADGVAWTNLYESEGGSDGDMYLRGDGSSSGDEVYLYFRHLKDLGSSYYNLESYAMTGYDAAFAGTVTSQMGVSDAHYILLSNSSIQYWFMVNSRRIMILAKVGTIYQSYYGGWYLPDGTPNDMPQPYFIGGTCRTSTTQPSSTSATHSAFFAPKTAIGEVRHTDGTWIDVTTSGTYMHPWYDANEKSHAEPANIYDGPGGGYLPIEASITSTANGGNNYGVLDGVYFIGGDNNASENTYFYGSSTFLVFQDTFRTERDDYAAFQME